MLYGDCIQCTCVQHRSVQYAAESVYVCVCVRVYIHRVVRNHGQTLQYCSCETEAKPIMISYELRQPIWFTCEDLPLQAIR